MVRLFSLPGTDLAVWSSPSFSMQVSSSSAYSSICVVSGKVQFSFALKSRILIVEDQHIEDVQQHC